MKKQIALVLTLLLAGCVRKEYIGHAVKPIPCQVAPWPGMPPVEASVCEADGVKYVCLDGPNAAMLGAYVEAVEAWHESLASCASVVESELPASPV